MKYIIFGSILSAVGFFSSTLTTGKVPVQVIEFETPVVITPSR